jgi:polyphenol oxidase
MHILSSHLLQSTGIVAHGISTRQGGVSGSVLGMNTSFQVGDIPENVTENRRLLLTAVGLDPDRLALPLQVHSGRVLRADAPGNYPACDALITNRTDVHLGVSVADCTPILLVDRARRVIAAVHAGWRGTVAEITRHAVEMMVGDYGCMPTTIAAFIGPCASVCCYAVGEEVAGQFPPDSITRNENQTFVDLKGTNMAQLIAAGVSPSMIEISPLCTISDSHLLHSYRRDRESSGRMMAVIGLVPA